MPAYAALARYPNQHRSRGYSLLWDCCHWLVADHSLLRSPFNKRAVLLALSMAAMFYVSVTTSGISNVGIYTLLFIAQTLGCGCRESSRGYWPHQKFYRRHHWPSREQSHAHAHATPPLEALTPFLGLCRLDHLFLMDGVIHHRHGLYYYRRAEKMTLGGY